VADAVDEVEGHRDAVCLVAAAECFEVFDAGAAGLLAAALGRIC
jgi:hypothetical protein